MLRRPSLWLALYFVFLATGVVVLSADTQPGPGVEYLHEERPAGPWQIHVIKIDRTRTDLAIITTLAKGTVQGLDTLSEQVKDILPALGKPVAAVNADFYWLNPGPYQGDPCGLHIVQGELVSAPVTGRPGFWIDAAGKLRIGQIQPKLSVTWPNGTTTAIGLNELRNDNAAVLYTPTLGPTTRTPDGRDVFLERDGKTPWLPLKAGQTCTARVRSVVDGRNSALSPDIMILSLGPDLLDKVPEVHAGDILTISTQTVPDLTNVATAIGGGPILLAQGKQSEWPGDQPRHPRTAIGWNDATFFLVVVDGRQANSVGMSFPELAELMSQLGCTDALNLDGGGSSTMWLSGRVVNSPSGGSERALANALVVVRTAEKKEPD